MFYSLQATSYKLQATSYLLLATCYKYLGFVDVLLFPSSVLLLELLVLSVVSSVAVDDKQGTASNTMGGEG
jgi:hypothetical protein